MYVKFVARYEATRQATWLNKFVPVKSGGQHNKTIVAIMNK